MKNPFTRKQGPLNPTKKHALDHRVNHQNQTLQGARGNLLALVAVQLDPEAVHVQGQSRDLVLNQKPVQDLAPGRGQVHQLLGQEQNHRKVVEVPTKDRGLNQINKILFYCFCIYLRTNPEKS